MDLSPSCSNQARRVRWRPSSECNLGRMHVPDTLWRMVTSREWNRRQLFRVSLPPLSPFGISLPALNNKHILLSACAEELHFGPRRWSAPAQRAPVSKVCRSAYLCFYVPLSHFHDARLLLAGGGEFPKWNFIASYLTFATAATTGSPLTPHTTNSTNLAIPNYAQ